MEYLSKKSILIMGFFLLIVIYACEPVPVDIEGPEISFTAEDGYLYKDTLWEKGKSFKVKINVTAGANDLDIFQVNENDTLLPVERIISGLNINPDTLSEADKQAFTKELEIEIHEEGYGEYTFFIQDAAGFTNGVYFAVNDLFEPLDGTFEGIRLENFEKNKEGLDLHTLELLPATDPSADITDIGINDDLPDNQNWWQKINGINDAQIFLPEEDVSFDEIDTKEQMLVVAENATELALSPILHVGDLVLVKTASLTGETSDYFLIMVETIVVTPNNNEDYYEFSLKQALNM